MHSVFSEQNPKIFMMIEGCLKLIEILFVFNGILFVLEWRKPLSPRFCLGFVTGTAVGIIRTLCNNIYLTNKRRYRL